MNLGSWAFPSLPTCGEGTRVLSQAEETKKTQRRDASSKVISENSFWRVFFVCWCVCGFFLLGIYCCRVGNWEKKKEHHLHNHLWQIPHCNSHLMKCSKIILEFWERLYFGTRYIFMILRMLYLQELRKGRKNRLLWVLFPT